MEPLLLSKLRFGSTRIFYGTAAGKTPDLAPAEILLTPGLIASAAGRE